MEQQYSDNPQQLDLLRVCRIGKAQGLKGEVTVRIFTDDPEWRFEPGSVLYSADGSTEYEVERSRTFKQRWIIKLVGIDDRTAAESLNGIELYGEADDAEAMLEDDEWYLRDLVGLETRLDEHSQLGDTGTVIGTVVDVLDGPQSLLKIRKPRETQSQVQEEVESQGETNSQDDSPAVTSALVPFVEQIVPEINLDEGYLTIDPPGGLIEWL